MFGSRKAEASNSKNSHQTHSHENEKDVPAEQRVDNLPPLELQHPANGGNLEQAPQPADRTDDQGVKVQMELAKRYADQPYAPTAESPSEVEDSNGTKLSIGSSVKMKGDVEVCGYLQVDGHFEAFAHSKELNVSEGGTFIGDAVVNYAEIRGRFEGQLTAKDKLVIRSAGIVSGTIKYGSIEIESGGKILGNIQELPQNETQNDTDDPGLSAIPATPKPTLEHAPPHLNLSGFRRDMD